jgi:hypothetical protein
MKYTHCSDPGCMATAATCDLTACPRCGQLRCPTHRQRPPTGRAGPCYPSCGWHEHINVNPVEELLTANGLVHGPESERRLRAALAMRGGAARVLAPAASTEPAVAHPKG